MLSKYLKKFTGNEILGKSAIAFVLKMVGMLSGYVFVALALHTVGLEEFGAFSLCLAIIQIGAIFGRLGFDVSIVKHVSELTAQSATGKINDVYYKGLKVVTIAGLLCSLAIALLAPFLADYIFHNSSLRQPFRLSAFAIIPTVFIYYNAGALRGLRRIAAYAGLINSNYIMAVIVLVASFLLTISDFRLVISYTIGSLLLSVISFILWRKHQNSKTTIESSGLTTKELINISTPMLWTGAINIINGWADTLLLGMLSTQEAVGSFHVLLKAAAILNVILFAVNSISAPQFARLNQSNDFKGLQRYVTKSTKLIVVLSIPTLILLLITYVPVINLLTDTFDPMDFIVAFIFLCIGQIINSFCGSGGQLLTMTGNQRINRNVTTFSFLVSIVLSLLLIPSYGVTGAAFANMCCLVIRNLLYVYYSKKLLGINTIYNPLIDLALLLKPKSA